MHGQGSQEWLWNNFLNSNSFEAHMESRLSAIISKEDTFFVARGIEIELASQGKTIEEALRNLKEAFELWLTHAEPSERELVQKTDSQLVTQVAVTA